jgi:hypothetical protein
MIANTSFEFLRQHKPVSAETESLVMKRLGNISQSELFTAFENGISGQYGKIYTLDVQTLLGWVQQYRQKSKSLTSFDTATLSNPDLTVTCRGYPATSKDWASETNKAYIAYLSGMDNWHPHVYHHLVLEGKITLGALKKYTPDTYPICPEHKINEALVKATKDYFQTCKDKGWNQIFV